MLIVKRHLRMSELNALYRLQCWLSPSFPIGAFSYSFGMEAAFAEGILKTQEDLHSWLNDSLTKGQGWNDAVLLAASWRAATRADTLLRLAGLARALCCSKERALESIAMGAAFLIASKSWYDDLDLPDDCPFPVAVGAAAGRSNIRLQWILTAYLQAFISNQVQAALRLVKLGQQDGVALTAALEERVLETAQAATKANLDDLGTSTFVADISTMRHETMRSRIFRT